MGDTATLRNPLESWQIYQRVDREEWDIVEELLQDVPPHTLPVVRGAAENTILHCATEKANAPISVVRRLLEVLEPSWTEQPNKWGLTPLHNAVDCSNHIDIVRMLVEAHPDAVDVQGPGGRTPMDCLLHRVAFEEYASGLVGEEHPEEVVRVLVQGRPDTIAGITGQQGRTLLHRACAQDNLPTSILGVLLEEAPAGIMEQQQVLLDDRGCTPLHLASTNDDEHAAERVRLLLEEVNSPENALQMKDSQGQTPLHYAIFWYASSDVVETLVDTCPSSVHSMDRAGKTPLDLFCDVNEFCDEDETQIKSARALLGALTRVEDQGSKEETKDCSPAILCACLSTEKQCPLDLIHFYLQTNPEQASQKDKKGNLPLHIAAEMTTTATEADRDGYVRLIHQLLQLHPCAARIPNDDGILPLGLFIRADKTWKEGIELVFCAHPAAVIDQGLNSYAMTALLSKLGKLQEDDDPPESLFRLLREAPFLIKRR